MFNETNFIDNFVKYYLDNNNYAYDEVNLLFDEYIENIVSSNSQEINEYIIRKYENPTNVDIIADIDDIDDRVAEILYDKFYDQAEAALVNQYESEADTEESDEIIDIISDLSI